MPVKEIRVVTDRYPSDEHDERAAPEPTPRTPPVKRDVSKAEALAQAIYDAVTNVALAKEVVALMKKHKLANKSDLREWQRMEEENEK